MPTTPRKHFTKQFSLNTFFVKSLVFFLTQIYAILKNAVCKNMQKYGTYFYIFLQKFARFNRFSQKFWVPLFATDPYNPWSQRILIKEYR